MYLLLSALCLFPSLLSVCLFLCLSICPFVQLPVCLSSSLPLWHLPNSNSAHRFLQHHERVGQVAAVYISLRWRGYMFLALHCGSEHCPPAVIMSLNYLSKWSEVKCGRQWWGSVANITEVPSSVIIATLGLSLLGKTHACLMLDT